MTEIRSLRFALRPWRGSPGVLVIAVLTLAVGIGATTAIFSALFELVLNPLPYRDASRLVTLSASLPSDNLVMVSVSVKPIDLWEDAESLEAVESYAAQEVQLHHGDRTEALEALRVDSGFLSFLGRRPILGRDFSEDDLLSDDTLILGHRLWTSWLGGDSEVIGSTLVLDGRSRTVIGVLPPAMPSPRGYGPDIELLLPLSDLDAQRSIFTMAHLRPGVEIEQAETELTELLRPVTEERPFLKGAIAEVRRPAELLGSSIRDMLWTLMAGVGLVLLIACGNVASLILGRSLSRRRELAVRGALGANRRNLVSQLLGESLVLTVLSALLGMGLAILGVELIGAFLPTDVEALTRIRVSPTVLGFALIVSLLSTSLFGLLPALRTTGALGVTDLRSGLSSTFSRRQWRTRAALIVGEVALSFVLLAAAVLLVRNVASLSATDVGFEPSGLLAAELDLPEWKYPTEASRASYHRAAIEVIGALDGVESVSLARRMPPNSGLTVGRLEVEGTAPSEEMTFLWTNTVQSNYFQLLRQPLIAGRAFDEGDTSESVGIVSETFAAQFWPGQSAIGRRLRLGSGSEWVTVIGVTGDIRPRGYSGGSFAANFDRLQVYFPIEVGSDRAQLIIRTASPGAVAGAIRDRLVSLDREIALEPVVTVDSMLADSISRQRFAMTLLIAFAASAVFLAAVGLYGAINQTVLQRRREIGIRLALGARGRQVVAMVLTQGCRLVGLGLLLGIGLALLSTRWISAQLFGVDLIDPPVFAATAAILTACALAALQVPTRRAARVHPSSVLREE